jgi:hypothetical protein
MYDVIGWFLIWVILVTLVCMFVDFICKQNDSKM